ncbi:MAG: elongation factor G [Bacilli bacterium]|jgi:elongation factor G|nr:elongation factor G [Acholeplasmataceae bacterium]
MKEYLANQLRNIAVLGHLGSGKTSLCEALLYESKAITKKGEVEKKNTVSDFLVEEQNRQTSLSTTLIPVEWKDNKINVLDTPGSEEFIGEIDNALSVVNGAVMVVDATKGIEVGTERLWNEARELSLPTIFLINKMDKENVKFDQVLDSLQTNFSNKIIPLYLPIGQESDFRGYVSVVEKKGYLSDGTTCEVDADTLAKVEEVFEQIVEAVAETSEELLDKFFSGEELTSEEIITGLRTGVLNGELFPVVVSSAVKNIGVDALIGTIIDYLPSPSDVAPARGINPKNNEEVERKSSVEEPFSAMVFKTIVDPFVGTINLFRVYSGSVKTAQEVFIPNSDTTVKMGQIVTLMGKTQIQVNVLNAGDIGAVTKMPELATGYTFCDKKDPIQYKEPELPTSTIYVAVVPKNKQDEDKISNAFQRLHIEDPTFEIRRNPETAQLLIGGQGMTHIGYILEKMKNMFKVEVDTADPKIVYRETIRSKAEGHGRHKKQSGGAGQFGEVYIRFEPSTQDFEFANEVVGGAVPKNYFPAVEKGLIETLEHGPLAGFPVIGVKATLFDGSYHPVDSNEISFKLAASLAFKDATQKLRPTILEPIMEVEITVKDEYIGDIMGDMTKRRGRVLGMDQAGKGTQKVKAEVPEAEIVTYTTDLKAMTQGSGYFTRKFVRYEEVPEMLVHKIIEEYKKERE